MKILGNTFEAAKLAIPTIKKPENTREPSATTHEAESQWSPKQGSYLRSASETAGLKAPENNKRTPVESPEADDFRLTTRQLKKARRQNAKLLKRQEESKPQTTKASPRKIEEQKKIK
ncbi:hypothetical protein HHI36_016979 [Cryptolaemus montrouzieri]|uniref:Uncharacterized protein n=1 Tax=Cryptolaemus montrouzieri TaxID=559131 RepID=A0ABD2NLP7_9CUCU